MVARVVWDHEAAGSSPATPTNINMREWLSGRASPCQGERREFESRLPLQNMRVWFNGRTSAFQAEHKGSIPFTRSNMRL